MPQLYHVGHGQGRQHRQRQRATGQARQPEVSAVQPVGHEPSDGRYHQERDHGREGDDSNPARRAGPLERHPPDSYKHRPHGGAGEHIGGPCVAVVPMPQGGKLGPRGDAAWRWDLQQDLGAGPAGSKSSTPDYISRRLRPKGSPMPSLRRLTRYRPHPATPCHTLKDVGSRQAWNDASAFRLRQMKGVLLDPYACPARASLSLSRARRCNRDTCI